MRTKKHPSKNEYILTADNIWVRNFNKKNIRYLDVNTELISDNDCTLFLQNETENSLSERPNISSENINHRKMVIVSDGLGFEELHKHLYRLNYNDVSVMAVNGALSKWTLVGKDCEHKRAINYYVTNNPYQDCSKFFPTKHKYFPRCIASIRTNNEFINKYKGDIYVYTPVPDERYSGYDTSSPDYKIDDYRNPVCAAIGLAYRFGVKKLLLLCCDDAFYHHRPSSIPAGNVWIYPQQKTSHDIIDANLYWFAKNEEIKIGYHSLGLKYANGAYIPIEEIEEFFEDNDGTELFS